MQVYERVCLCAVFGVSVVCLCMGVCAFMCACVFVCVCERVLSLGLSGSGISYPASEPVNFFIAAIVNVL